MRVALTASLALAVAAAAASGAVAATAGRHRAHDLDTLTDRPGFIRYNVLIKPTCSLAQGTTAVGAANGDVALEIPEISAISFYLPAASRASTALLHNPCVESIEQDAIRSVLGWRHGPDFSGRSDAGAVAARHAKRTTGSAQRPAQRTPYGVDMVNANQLAGGTGSNAWKPIVCVVDTGLDTTHEDLRAGTFTSCPSGCAGQPDGCTFGNFDDTSSGTCPLDRAIAGQQTLYGHGTHVAGSIAARDNDHGVVGVYPNADLYIVRTFGGNGAWTYASSLTSACLRCQSGGASVINLSLGGNGGSAVEAAGFNALAASGILSVAAAGNDGTTARCYPGSYSNVLSVASVNAAGVQSYYSQYNDAVDLAAPGEEVLSTVPMFTGTELYLIVDGVEYALTALDNSGFGQVGGVALFDCGQADGLCGAGANGTVCLVQRNDTFAVEDQTQRCIDAGAAAVVLANNEPGDFLTSLGAYFPGVPVGTVSQADGAAILARFGSMSLPAATASMSIGIGHYDISSGTSMATPHVSAVAALVWSYNKLWSAKQVRGALLNTADHPEVNRTSTVPFPRDDRYGYGIVQAAAALDCLSGGSSSPACARCGDGACIGGETCSNCPADCKPKTPNCGDHLCQINDGENCYSCPSDCLQNASTCCGYDNTNSVGCAAAMCNTTQISCVQFAVGTKCLVPTAYTRPACTLATPARMAELCPRTYTVPTAAPSNAPSRAPTASPTINPCCSPTCAGTCAAFTSRNACLNPKCGGVSTCAWTQSTGVCSCGVTGC